MGFTAKTLEAPEAQDTGRDCQCLCGQLFLPWVSWMFEDKSPMGAARHPGGRASGRRCYTDSLLSCVHSQQPSDGESPSLLFHGQLPHQQPGIGSFCTPQWPFIFSL